MCEWNRFFLGLSMHWYSIRSLFSLLHQSRIRCRMVQFTSGLNLWRPLISHPGMTSTRVVATMLLSLWLLLQITQLLHTGQYRSPGSFRDISAVEIPIVRLEINSCILHAFVQVIGSNRHPSPGRTQSPHLLVVAQHSNNASALRKPWSYTRSVAIPHLLACIGQLLCSSGVLRLLMMTSLVDGTTKVCTYFACKRTMSLVGLIHMQWKRYLLKGFSDCWILILHCLERWEARRSFWTWRSIYRLNLL